MEWSSPRRCRVIDVINYQNDPHAFIPNSENWDPCSTKSRDYRLYRQALNAYKMRTGGAWRGTLQGCVDYFNNNDSF